VTITPCSWFNVTSESAASTVHIRHFCPSRVQSWAHTYGGNDGIFSEYKNESRRLGVPVFAPDIAEIDETN
jgi:hypothetical protein